MSGRPSFTTQEHEIRDAESFIWELKEERNNGFGFVPLIGAGASAPAGVPLIYDIQKYLRRCIAMALGLAGPEEQYWNPRTDAWPPIDELHGVAPRDEDCRLRQEDNWFDVIKRVLEDRSRRTESSSRTRDKVPIPLLQEALGALAEWRSSLMFLARLHDDGKKISLRERDQEIIDRFFTYVVQGKSPTLVHRMLAFLANPLRFETILTTNFDDLLDDALRDLNIPLDVVDVHLQSGLPPYSSVRSRRTVVKLHGGKYGLRADYSLEAYPDFEDRRHFASYLLGQSISTSEWEQELDKALPVRNHLLVIGYSGGDLRINALIRETLLRYSGRVKVFWVCYSDNDVDRLVSQEDGIITYMSKQSLVGKSHTKSVAQSVQNAFVVTRHSFLDLLFLQLYQDTSLGLPPAGVVFPSVAELPIPVTTDRSGEETKRFRLQREEDTHDWESPLPNAFDRDKLRTCLDSAIDYKVDRWQGSHRCVVVSSSKTVHGITSLASEVFSKQMLAKQRHCVWLDTDDTATPDALFEQVLAAVALRSGVSDWVPMLLGEDSPNRTLELARLTKRSSQKWVIFIHVRDGAGSNHTGLTSKQGKRSNGWCDISEKEASELAIGASKAIAVTDRAKRVALPCTEGFLELLRHICASECGNVTIVVLCHDGPLFDRLLCEPVLLATSLKLSEEKRQQKHPSYSIEKTIANAWKWASCKHPSGRLRGTLRAADTPIARKRFLHALVLCARTRYPSLLWSWAFHTPSSSDGLVRFELTHKWLEQLKDADVIRRKPGGFIWLHAGVRDGLRKKFRNAGNGADIHHCLAEWYEKLFAASRDPMAVFEVVYHRCNAAARWLDNGAIASKPDLRSESPDDKDVSRNCCRKALADLHQAAAILGVSKASLLSKMFSKGKLDQLKVVGKEHLKLVHNSVATACQACNPKVACRLRGELDLECLRIKKQTHRLSKLIGREVADLDTAFSHARECWETECDLLVGESQLGQNGSDKQGQSPADSAKKWEPTHEEGLLLRDLKCEFQHEWGVLCIAARAYPKAERYFKAVYRRYRFPFDELEKLATSDPGDGPGGVIDHVVEWAVRTQNSGQPDSRTRNDLILLRVVYTLERHMELFLLQGQLVHLLSRRYTPPPKDSKYANRQQVDFCGAACMCHRAACEIMRFLPSERQEELYHERQRLDTQYGLALACRRDFVRAHQRLREAESFLSMSQRNEHSLESAIIELHRAEVYAQQAVFQPVWGRDEPTSLERIRQAYLRPVDTRDPASQKSEDLASKKKAWETLECLSKLRPTDSENSDFRQCNDFLKQANSHLLIAERLLGQQRKNVWWVTAYFELRLKVIELELAAAANTPEASIPVIGWQCSPGWMLTEADRLIDDACRMVRLDVFRLARIAESYARCLVIATMHRDYQVNVFQSKPSKTSIDGQEHCPEDTLAFRRHLMVEQCNNARESLINRLERRKRVLEPLLDKGVQCYVEDVIDRLEHAVEFAQTRRRVLDILQSSRRGPRKTGRS
jgi:hypothetical protein